MPWGEKFEGWNDLLTGHAKLGEIFAGPLGWATGPTEMGHGSRHQAYRDEAGKLCWDTSSESVVRVADWAKDEYWGERVLVVSELIPGCLRGLSIERRQSKLIELSASFQGSASLAALCRVDNDQCERLKGMIGAAWTSLHEAKMLAESVPCPEQFKARPRI